MFAHNLPDDTPISFRLFLAFTLVMLPEVFVGFEDRELLCLGVGKWIANHYKIVGFEGNASIGNVNQGRVVCNAERLD